MFDHVGHEGQAAPPPQGPMSLAQSAFLDEGDISDSGVLRALCMCAGLLRQRDAGHCGLHPRAGVLPLGGDKACAPREPLAAGRHVMARLIEDTLPRPREESIAAIAEPKIRLHVDPALRWFAVESKEGEAEAQAHEDHQQK